MTSSKPRFALAILAFVLAAAVNAGPSQAQHAKTGGHQRQNPMDRKTTNAPTMAQGKLGQDLFMAVGRRDLAAVKSLLKHGADPNSRNGLLFTPLYIAAASAQPDVVEALLHGGAKLEAASPYGTAFMFACMSGAVPSINVLLAKGANVNATRVDGINVLMLASRSCPPPIVGEILRRKVDVNAKDGDGATALIFAAREGKTDVGKMLVDAGAAVDAADSHGHTPLMYAAMNGHADFVKMLLDKGAKADAADAKERTALMLAATYGDYPDVVRALQTSGAGSPAAYAVAVARGHTECAKLLGDSTAAGTPERAAKVAVQKSLGLVQRSMLLFNQRTGCVSCHQEGLARMATAAARERGFALDPASDKAARERVTGVVSATCGLHTQALKDPAVMKQVPLIEIGEVATAYCWLLAGMAAHKQPADPGAGAMTMVLARQQAPDGSWQFALPRVPMQSSFFTFTALAIRSLRAYGPAANAKEIAERIERAKTWLVNTPTTTSEDRTFRLLGLKWAGASDAEKLQAAEQIRADQRPDGGWSQLPGLQSDAYATGEALYALHTAGGAPVTDPVYERGVQFLVRTQDEDGSWFVNKRAMPANNYFDAGFPHGESQYASFNGTCWAMMALLQTITPSQRQASNPGQ